MKTWTHFTAVIFILVMVASCSAKKTPGVKPQTLTAEQAGKLDTAYVASGCFWCVEEVYQRVKGVKEAVSGYSGGTQPNPTYEEVSRGRTDHAESVMILYDPQQVTYQQLVQVYFNSQDPTQVNGQGPDHGSQYRSIIFYQTAEEKQIAQEEKQKLADSGKYEKPIAANIMKFNTFYKAEDYHQEYFTKHPNHPYIRSESRPRVERFMKAMPDILKEEYQ